MFALALCHTVMTENESDSTLRDFKAESPDEAALVSVARDMVSFSKAIEKLLAFRNIWRRTRIPLA